MTEAIIVGGGLAGRATALALARAGIGSTVYEAGTASRRRRRAPGSPSPATAWTR